MATITTDYAKAVDVIAGGGVAALPTDTVYGLAANVLDIEAMRRVYAIKKRPLTKAMPVFVSSYEALTLIVAGISDTAKKLIDCMWPGALTLVFKLNPEFRTLAAAGGDTIAVRIPDHDMTLKILTETGVPLSGTSANLSGGPNPITADDVYGQIGGSVDIIVDGGPCRGTVASTIIDVSQGRPKVVRYGAVSKEDIEEACGTDVEFF